MCMWSLVFEGVVIMLNLKMYFKVVGITRGITRPPTSQCPFVGGYGLEKDSSNFKYMSD